MEATFAEAGLLQRRLPFVVVGVRDEGAPSGAGEHPAFVLPELPGCGLFLVLLRSVFFAEQL